MNKKREKDTSNSNLPPGKVQKNVSTDKKRKETQKTLNTFFQKANGMW